MHFKPRSRPNLTSGERRAIADLRADPDIVILPADKGRKTVLLDVSEYDRKVRTLLDDEHTYQKISKDPTAATEQELNRLLRKFLNEKKITDAQYRHLRSSGGQTPRFYGLPKVHKPGIPLRPIVSFVNSPTINSSRFLSDILTPIAMDNPFRAKNGAEVVNSIQNITLDENEEMVSFDVVALFTSIPTDLACDITHGRLLTDDDLPNRTALSPADVILLLRFCLRATYFSYGGQLYKQVFGTAMGSPVSATVADIVMRHIEENAINSFPHDIKFWSRFVDDILSFLRREHTQLFLSHLNTIDPHIAFTLERESDGHLPFLDTDISRRSDGTIATSVHRKTTHTDSYLHFESNHPPSHKAAVVKTLLGRVSTHISEDSDKRHEEQHVKDALQRCGYNEHFIVKNAPTPRTVTPGDREGPKFRAPIPYVPGLSEQLSRILRRHNIGSSFVPGSSLRDLLVHPKDSVPISSQAGVVYRVPCRDCEKSYFGETQRRLGDRLKEHQKAVRDGDSTASALAEHVYSCYHRIDWEHTEVVDRSNNWRERKYRESVAIALDSDNINRDKGLELPVQFISIIKSTR